MRRIIFLFVVLALLGCCGAAHADLLISEIGPSNHCAFFDENGDTPDWIELYNDGAQDLSLDGWRLSEDETGKEALALSGDLPAGAYRLVAVPEDAGWKLSASGESVCLLQGDAVRQKITYPALAQDVSYALVEGRYSATWLPTPGSMNMLLQENEPFPVAKGPRFSEFLTTAAPYQAEPGYDFLELTNTGKDTSLSGWQIRLGMAGSKSYVLPKKKTLEKNWYYGIYCTEEEIKPAHAGFNLPAQGAILSLWRPDGTLADFVRLPEQYPNISYGLTRDRSAFGYLAEPTYGRRNGLAFPGRAEAPVLSRPGGVCPGETVTVEMTAPEDFRIRYTLDGTAPTAKSAMYTEPLIFTKTTVLRAATFGKGLLPSAEVSATYVLGLEADYPVICLIIDEKYLYDKKMGVISGATDGVNNWKFDWEYPAHFEYFDKEGRCRISQACGFGVQGDSSRGHAQKSFQLVARKAYGNALFEFNPFENRSFSGYKSFNLRAAGSEGPINVRFRDAALSSLAEGTELLYSAAQPALVYLNGEIYGHYNLRERINKHFIAQHLGITDDKMIDQIDILSETGDWVRNGSGADYKALSRFMKNKDLNVPENLDYVLERMDVQSYFEYVAFMLLTGNRDLSNSRFYRVPGGKWKWILYDIDRGMEKLKETTAFEVYTRGVNQELTRLTDHVPFVALMRVPAMREKFLTILGNLMVTRFQPDDLIALIDQWHDRVAPIMPYQLARWTKDDMRYWETLVEKMRDVARQRSDYVVAYAWSYFKMTDEEVQRYFGAYLQTKK